MDGLCELSESTRPDGIFSSFEASDGTLGHSGPAREQLCGKLFRFRPDLVEILGVNYSFVLAKGFVRRVQKPRFSHHGQIGSATPPRRCFFADVVKRPSNDMPAHKQADCLAGTCSAVGSAKLGFGSGQKMIDFVFHRPQRQPTRRLG
jgi:hypothetical protein